MSSKKHLLEKVISDRKLGMSLGDISRKYSISKSTVSLWCKDMKLSKKIKDLIFKEWLRKTNDSRSRGTLKIKQKRIDSLERERVYAKEMVGNITDRDLMVMGIGLYWAEGSKKETGAGFSFINSDPIMVKMMYKWLSQVVKVKREQLIINLVINISHKQREAHILKFWSNLLDFPMKDFGNTTFIKVKNLKVYNNHSDYYGMLRVKVRSSSWLRRRILGMIGVFKDTLST